MTDQPFPDRVTQLRRRWEADKTSRLFLQLAEEYRQLGRLRESLDVLDEGLREHPGYLSALVAKGRCHLELDEPQAAREVLERVVRQDATQAVASKLLVRAYIGLGELSRARERLSLYALLHESDPDVAELRRRLEAPEPAPPPVVAVARGGTHDQPAAEPTGAPLADPVRSDTMSEDIFDLGPVSRKPAPIPPADDLLGLYDGLEAGSRSAGVEVASSGEIFGGLGGPENRRRWADALARGGIFDLADLGVGRPVSSSVASRPEVVQPTAPIPVPASFEPPVFQPELTAPALGFEPAPFEPPRFELSPAEERAEPVAPTVPDTEPIGETAGELETETVTLAALYLRQGHRDEALRILGQVLRREPGNAAAHELAARIRQLPEQAPAVETTAPLDSPSAEEWEPEPELSDLATRLAPIQAPALGLGEALAEEAIEAPEAFEIAEIEPMVIPELPEAVEASAPTASAPVASAPASKARGKIQLLSAYLERLRRGSVPGVS